MNAPTVEPSTSEHLSLAEVRMFVCLLLFVFVCLLLFVFVCLLLFVFVCCCLYLLFFLILYFVYIMVERFILIWSALYRRFNCNIFYLHAL